MITKRELPRQREVRRNIRLGVLHVIALVLVPNHPGLMLMIGIDVWRIWLVRETGIALRVRKRAKVVVVGMVFLDDDHHVIDKRTETYSAAGFRFHAGFLPGRCAHYEENGYGLIF